MYIEQKACFIECNGKIKNVYIIHIISTIMKLLMRSQAVSENVINSHNL